MSCLGKITNVLSRLNNVSSHFWCAVKAPRSPSTLLPSAENEVLTPERIPVELRGQETGTHWFKNTREPLQLAVGTTKTSPKENFQLNSRFQAMPAVHRCESCKGEVE